MMRLKPTLVSFTMLLLLPGLLTACAASPAASPTQTAAPTSSSQAVPTAAILADVTQPEPTSAAITESASPTAIPLPSETSQPSLAEWALALFPEPAQAAGRLLVLYGQVLDVNGAPIPGAAVEIWQTDAQGIYDHPNEANTASRDPDFQFYGTSVSDDQGRYAFRTITPAAYGSRPPHIHVRVRLNGEAALTTQFYFVEDRAVVENEGLFLQAGEQGSLLILQPLEASDASGNPVRLAAANIVLDTGIGSGSLALTPSQAEGPYYPRTDVSAFDADLAVVD